MKNGYWTRSKTWQDERMCNFLDTEKVGDEIQCPLHFPTYTYTRSNFQAIYDFMNLHNVLTHEN